VEEHADQEGPVPAYGRVGERNAFHEGMDAKAGEHHQGERMFCMQVHMSMFHAMAEKGQHDLEQEPAEKPQPDPRARTGVQLGQHVEHHHPEQEGPAEVQ
jgi:hypothetical protein